jgi:hypothetical protein
MMYISIQVHYQHLMWLFFIIHLYLPTLTHLTLSLPWQQYRIRTLVVEVMQVQSQRGQEVPQITHGAILVAKSPVQLAQLETMLCLHQPLALNVPQAHLVQSLLLVQLFVQDNAVKASIVLLDRPLQKQIHVEMLV